MIRIICKMRYRQEKLKFGPNQHPNSIKVSTFMLKKTIKYSATQIWKMSMTANFNSLSKATKT